jgi:hypothetical protein
MAHWIIILSLVAFTGMMLVGVVSVLRAFVVDRGKRPDERHDRAAGREQKWYPLRRPKWYPPC